MKKGGAKNDARGSGEEKSGWESLTEEAASGALAPNEELEEALREAAEAVDVRRAEKAPAGAPDEGTEEKPAAAPGEAGLRPAPKPA